MLSDFRRRPHFFHPRSSLHFSTSRLSTKLISRHQCLSFQLFLPPVFSFPPELSLTSSRQQPIFAFFFVDCLLQLLILTTSYLLYRSCSVLLIQRLSLFSPSSLPALPFFSSHFRPSTRTLSPLIFPQLSLISFVSRLFHVEQCSSCFHICTIFSTFLWIFIPRMNFNSCCSLRDIALILVASAFQFPFIHIFRSGHFYLFPPAFCLPGFQSDLLRRLTQLLSLHRRLKCLCYRINLQLRSI